MNRMDRVEPNSGSGVGKQQTFHLGKVYITNPLVVILGIVYYWVCHTIGKVSYFFVGHSADPSYEQHHCLFSRS